MNLRFVMGSAVLVVSAIVGSGYQSAATAAAEESSAARPVPLYDSDPQHLWNRLHGALWDRVGLGGHVYGHDRVDPLLWPQTRHLLEGISLDTAQQVLREFLNSRGERLINDPLKRAVLQRDLWTIFDWLVGPHIDDRHLHLSEQAPALLRRPLAEAIGRLALDAEAIDKLPDAYASAVASGKFAAAFDPAHSHTSFLPPDLFDPAGPWVCVGRNGSDIVAPAHASSFSRSVAQVFLNLPAGRKATTDYLTALSVFNEPFHFRPLPDGRFVLRPNPELPQFAAGTQVALVRSMLLIDSQGELRATKLIESVQLRAYGYPISDLQQGNFEFTLSRERLFAGAAGGLHAVALDERDFLANFQAGHLDEIESDRNVERKTLDRQMHVVRNRCVGCHDGPGVQSFNTFVGGFSPPQVRPSFHDSQTTAHGETGAIRNKQTRYDWGLLEGLLSETRP